MDWSAFTICQAIRGANAFSEFEDYFSSQMDGGDDNVKNFIPARESNKGEVVSSEDIYEGLNVFNIDTDSIPNENQIKEIWFTFNIICNFICNKNLVEGGRPEKFIAWVEMAQIPYPTNPSMNLFLTFAYVLVGDQVEAKARYEKVIEYGKTDYWKKRFASFGLDEVSKVLPESKDEVYKKIEYLRGFVGLSSDGRIFNNDKEIENRNSFCGKEM